MAAPAGPSRRGSRPASRRSGSRSPGSARRTCKRVYAWGNSLGGLITETLAESRTRACVDGVAPLCGVLAGTNKNLDLALDVAVAVKQFFYPKLKLTGYRSAAEAQANVDAAMKAILSRLADPAKQPGTAARLLGLTALTAASSKTQDFSGAGLTSSVSAAVETLQTALTYGTVGRYDIEQRVGGNPSTNVGVDYRNRVTPAAIAAVHRVRLLGRAAQGVRQDHPDLRRAGHGEEGVAQGRLRRWATRPAC